MRGGLGTASTRLASGATLGVLTVCNAWGDVVDPRTGEILAGARDPEKRGSFLDTDRYVSAATELQTRYFGMNTTLAVVATDAPFNREQATMIAMMAQDGIARVIRPSHTMFDGDVVFVLATGTSPVPIDVNIAGAVAARLVAESIVRGVAIANGGEIP